MHQGTHHPPGLPLRGADLEGHIEGGGDFSRPATHELVDVAGTLLRELLSAGFTPKEAARIGRFVSSQALNMVGGKN